MERLSLFWPSHPSFSALYKRCSYLNTATIRAFSSTGYSRCPLTSENSPRRNPKSLSALLNFLTKVRKYLSLDVLVALGGTCFFCYVLFYFIFKVTRWRSPVSRSHTTFGNFSSYYRFRGIFFSGFDIYYLQHSRLLYTIFISVLYSRGGFPIPRNSYTTLWLFETKFAWDYFARDSFVEVGERNSHRNIHTHTQMFLRCRVKTWHSCL